MSHLHYHCTIVGQTCLFLFSSRLVSLLSLVSGRTVIGCHRRGAGPTTAPRRFSFLDKQLGPETPKVRDLRLDGAVRTSMSSCRTLFRQWPRYLPRLLSPGNSRTCGGRLLPFRRTYASISAAELKFGQPLHETHPHILSPGECVYPHYSIVVYGLCLGY